MIWVYDLADGFKKPLWDPTWALFIWPKHCKFVMPIGLLEVKFEKLRTPVILLEQ